MKTQFLTPLGVIKLEKRLDYAINKEFRDKKANTEKEVRIYIFGLKKPIDSEGEISGLVLQLAINGKIELKNLEMIGMFVIDEQRFSDALFEVILKENITKNLPVEDIIVIVNKQPEEVYLVYKLDKIF